jgi:hypothetical protein
MSDTSSVGSAGTKCRLGDTDIVMPVTGRSSAPPCSGLDGNDATTPDMPGRGTMGLLMSDTLLTDPVTNEALRLLDTLRELADAPYTTSDAYADDGADVPG